MFINEIRVGVCLNNNNTVLDLPIILFGILLYFTLMPWAFFLYECVFQHNLLKHIMNYVVFAFTAVQYMYLSH